MENDIFLQLGYFAKLPPEIRLDIWEHLFSSCQIREQLPQRDSESEPRNLSILYANHYLHAEISNHLYSSLTHTIHISPIYDRHKWMTAKVSSKELNIEWDLDDKEAARRYFINFPHYKVPLRVEIHAPTHARKDPGQMVLLWQKVTALVERLMTLPEAKEWQGKPRLYITLVGRWESKGKPKRSLPGTGCGNDYKLVMMPFFRLVSRLNDRLDLSDDMRITIGAAGGQHDIGFVSHYVEAIRFKIEALKRKDNKIFDELHYLNSWHAKASLILDKKLDDLRGETANRLRLERFSKWFEDGDSWKSEYQEQFLANFPMYLEGVLKYDTLLRDTSRRYRFLILLHHMVHAMTDDQQKVMHALESEVPRLYTTWDSNAWHVKFPDGISRLTFFPLPPCIRRNETFLKIAYKKEIKQISQFSEDLTWWGWDALDVINKRMPNYYCCSICFFSTSPCRYCTRYDIEKMCRRCRKFEETGKWPE